jgi:hypothetical protein
MACACLWLATKLEESPRKLRDVLNVFLRMECRREGLPLEVRRSFYAPCDHVCVLYPALRSLLVHRRV